MKHITAELPRTVWFVLYYLVGIAAVSFIALLLKSGMALL